MDTDGSSLLVLLLRFVTILLKLALLFNDSASFITFFTLEDHDVQFGHRY